MKSGVDDCFHFSDAGVTWDAACGGERNPIRPHLGRRINPEDIHFRQARKKGEEYLAQTLPPQKNGTLDSDRKATGDCFNFNIILDAIHLGRTGNPFGTTCILIGSWPPLPIFPRIPFLLDCRPSPDRISFQGKTVTYRPT